jgi:radical SAM superfamily enzyme YgiQ (UPF0313 family)
LHAGNLIDKQSTCAMEKVVVLHACPPVQNTMPLASLTILKSFLVENGFEVRIIYWNLIFKDLQSSFLFEKVNIESNSNHSELLFLNYLAITKNDQILYKKVRTILMLYDMEGYNKDCKSLDRHMYNFKEKTDEVIRKTIINYKLSEALCFGFSLKLDQWLFAFILGDILKVIFNDKQIIVGGINTKKSAISILCNFRQFDIAVWGEGEYQLLQIVKELETGSSHNFDNIPNIVYNKDDKIVVSNSSHKKYIDLSEPTLMDFSDYFTALKQSTTLYKANCLLPIEGSRGCHWGRCHFCYLNVGYRYRMKDIDKLKKEITTYIQQWGVYSFIFLDNDIMGVDLVRFNKLLDCFIEIKKIEPKFRIVSAEIITKDLDRQTIVKMSTAGFFSVQIGWESASDILLTKIGKKNTFTSNIFFLKVAAENGIRTTGMNVIANLFEETEADIFEAIQNTKFLRFFRNSHETYQTPSRLTVNATSKYVLEKKDFDRQHYVPLKLLHGCVSDYVNSECAWGILDYWLAYKNEWWEVFDKLEIHYRKNRYSYKLTVENKHIKFREFINFKEVNTTDFLCNSLDFHIFVATNDPISLKKLCDCLHTKYCININKEDVINVLDSYFKKGLIYHNNDYTEIVSIINFKIT